MLVMIQNFKNHSPSEFCNVVIFQVFEKHKEKFTGMHADTSADVLAGISRLAWEFNRRPGQFDPLPISESVNIIICHHCSEPPSPPPLTSSAIFYLMYSPPHNPRLVEYSRVRT